MFDDPFLPNNMGSPVGRSSFCFAPPSTPPRASPSSGASLSTPPPLRTSQLLLPSPTKGGGGGNGGLPSASLFSSPQKTPDRPTPDRYIPDRISHDQSMSYFYLTSKENTTTSASLLRNSGGMVAGGIGADSAQKLTSSFHSALQRTPSVGAGPAGTGISGIASPQASLLRPTISSSEPYTQMLARTLFPSPQTSVLGLHEPNIPIPTDEDRYASSLGVVYEENRHANFMSKTFRIIAQTPERILDAPELLDDFYLNLVDWSSTNLLTVALRHTVYLWNADTGAITQLMSTPHPENYVSSVSWHQNGDLLAIGLNDAEIQIWSASSKTLVQTVKAHSGRVGSLSWNGHILAAGSRDTTITLTDTREQRTFATLAAHAQEVCGLRWSPNGQQLASGGNDNLLYIWEYRRFSMECVPTFTLRQHTAAVKALAWNPMQPNLLASGGGTTDRTIRFWDTTTGQCLNCIDTKSQVCGILWSRSGTELVSSHGVSDNQLTIWKYPTLRKVADLTGHTLRVLHLAMSPDGEVVVSASGDETIRFWRCFPPSREDTPTSVGRLSVGSPATVTSSRRSGGPWGGASPSAAAASTAAMLDEMLR